MTNLENSAVASGLEKVSFHSNPKGNPLQWNCGVLATEGPPQKSLIVFYVSIIF